MCFKTKRLYTDTSQFDNGQFLFAHPFAQSIEWLYDEDNFPDERNWFYCLDGVLPLCDFMTIVGCVVSYALNDFGESNIKQLINALEYGKETHKWGENTPYLKYEDDYMIIGKMRSQSTEVVLWAAYLYCKVRSEIEDKSSKVHKGQALLYKLYTQKTGLKSEYVGESFLMRHYDETRNSFLRHIKDSNDFKQLLKQAKVTKSNDQKPDMEQSVISKIPANSIRYYYEGWRNGKKGSFVQEDGIYRFYEMRRDENGNLIEVHKKKEDNPIVVKGIVSNWLVFKSHTDLLLKRLTKYETDIPESITKQFEDYTTIRFNQFKAEHRDDPDTWDWDWEYEFYGRVIIPQELGFNKLSEALFDYISNDDIKLIRSVMANYIKYLKKCRKERGYYISPELMVLRTIDTQDGAMLEDLEDDEIIVILDKLESKGFIKVAWGEGHIAEAFRLLPQGKVHLKQLEEWARTGKKVVETPAPAAEETENEREEEVESEEEHEEKWNDCFDGFLHPNLNPQAIKKALDGITHQNFPKNQRGFWWVFYTVTGEIHWRKKNNQKLVLQWANLHFECGWDWNKDNQFKFTEINSAIRKVQPSSKWNSSITGNIIGDYYGELAKTMKDTFVEIVNDGKLLDKSQFIKLNCTRINNGRK